MRGSWKAGFGVLCLVFAACGGESESEDDEDGTGGGGGSSGGAPTSWATACTRSADIVCDKFDECWPFFTSALLPADCATFYGTTCRDLEGLPGATITPAALLRCYEVYERMSCDDLLYDAVLPAECEFSGTRGPGDPCANNVQCQSGSCSQTTTDCGVCEVLATEGQSCFEVPCAAPLECNIDSICVQAKKLGDPCSIDDPCSLLLSCTGGVCSKPPGPGAPCSTEVLSCDLFRGATCNLDTGLCETLDVPDLGEACDGICRAGTYCNDDVTPAICVATPGEGAACNVEIGPDCATSLTCSNGVCTPFDPASCG